LTSHNGQIKLGGNGAPGDLLLFKDDDDTNIMQPSIRLDGQEANLHMGGNEKRGVILLFPEDGSVGDPDTATVELNGQHANLLMGGNQADGDLILQDSNGRDTIHLDAAAANIHLGGQGRDGNLLVYPYLVNDHSPEYSTIRLDGANGVIRAGGWGVYGAVVIQGLEEEDRIRLISAESGIHLGGNGAHGDLFIYPSEGDNHTDNQASIHLDGQEGDIVLRNADCAEDFDVAEGEEIEPGTVVVMNQEGQLQQSTQAYDKKVAGVISGAGDRRPGIVLGRHHAHNSRLPVALTGKVYCKVDAQYSPVEVGDLLTTSPTPGYAMKAEDPLQAFGAVIGKALQRLSEGSDLVPILVALQ
jgi:hypothetical protein